MPIIREVVTRLALVIIWLGIMAAIEVATFPLERDGPPWFSVVRSTVGLAVASSVVILIIRYLKTHRDA